MIIFLLLLQAVLCGAILYKEILVRDCRNLASTIFFAVYAVVYILEPMVLHIFFGGAISIVNGSDHHFDDDLVYFVFNIIGLTLLSFGAVISAYRKDIARSATTAIKPELSDLTGYLSALIILGLALFVYATDTNFLDLLQASRFAWFGNDNFQVGYSAASAYLLALTPVYVYLISRQADKTKVLIFVTLLAVLVYGVITKDRKWIFYIISGWLAAKYHRSNNKLFITPRAFFGVSSLFLLLLFSQFIRDAAPRYFLNEDFDPFLEFPEWIAHLFEYSDLSYFYRATIEAIHQNLNHDFYIFFGLLRRILLFFIPAGLSGGLKAEDISAIFSDVVGGEDDLRRGSMPPGLFGLFVVSFGWVVSALLMPLLAIGLAKADTLFRAKSSLPQVAIMTLFPTSVVFGFRGDESTAFYFPAINLIVLSLLVKIAKLKL